MKQPKKPKADTSPITITCTLTKEELERFREEWMKCMQNTQIRIDSDTVIEPVNTEPTTKKETVKFNYEGGNMVLEGKIVKTYENEYIIKTEFREYMVNKKDVDVTEPTTKKEIDEWIKDRNSSQCKEFIRVGELIKKDRERTKTHIKVFITKTNVFRAQISEPNKPMYEVTVGGENWNKGIGKEHTEEIQRKCWKLIGILSEQLTRFE